MLTRRGESAATWRWRLAVSSMCSVRAAETTLGPGAWALGRIGIDRLRRDTETGAADISLLECARKASVRLVQLSPPLGEAPTAGVPAGPSTDVTGDVCAERRRLVAGALDAPLPVASEAARWLGRYRRPLGMGIGGRTR